MSTTLVRTVLAADLRGSISLFETLGNASATALVTRCVGALGEVVVRGQGQVFKTLGDGLMATFASAEAACLCSERLHAQLEVLASADRPVSDEQAAHTWRLRVALATGEVVEQQGDYFGDAVNVAARLIEHAGDDETLVTASLLEALPLRLQGTFRSLDRLAIRGRSEPVGVWVAVRQQVAEAATTHFGDPALELPRRMRLELAWPGHRQAFSSADTPIMIGRDPQSTCSIDLPTVSRSHARIDWHSGGFQLTDLSFNGTHVQVRGAEPLSLRRGTCTLVGTGRIGLGAPTRSGRVVGLDFLVASEP